MSALKLKQQPQLSKNYRPANHKLRSEI